MKHYFLGTAAGISQEERVLRRKLKGNKADYDKLNEFLLNYYDGEKSLVLRNGRSAIAAGLKCSGLEKGEVIINGFTCRAVVQGVKAAGMTPVYADITRETLNFSVSDLEKVLTKNTRAVIVQNTLGNMVEIKKIEAFCKEHHLILIEDLAHCFGLKYKDGREAGKVGDVTILSFGKEKMIDAGNGGAVIFRRFKGGELPKLEKEPPEKEEFRSRIYPTISHFYRGLSYVGLAGIFMRLMLKMGYVVKSAEGGVDLESHLGYFQAKLALEKLIRNGSCQMSSPIRNSQANFYGGPPAFVTRSDNDLLREFYLVNNREECLKELKRAGYYFSGFWYEKPVAPERYYKKVHFPEGKCPNAVYISEHIINLPTYYDKKELEKAREIIKKYLVEEKNE